MKLTFLGASGGVVTGSCYEVESGGARLLVDCGMFQGGAKVEGMNRIPASVRAPSLDSVVLTHGHLDHCGRLPLLERAGFRGVVHATPATIELAGLILRDAAKIQEHDTERKNRKRARAGLAPLEPLFVLDDVESILRRFRPVPYNQTVPVAPGVEAVFHEAGHMLGSASVGIMTGGADGRKKLVVFSGDLGPRGLPILQDSQCFYQADAVVMESTYGDRDHRPLAGTIAELKEILKDVVARRGRVLVPAFAVGRTQQMIYHLVRMFADGEVEPFPIFVDSPMAASASRIYMNHPELYDEEARQMGNHRPSMDLMRQHVHETESAEESMRLNDMPGPCMIMAGAGMCNAGRILHHLRHGLWREDTHVLIVGYQADGTLGRMLVQGRPEVKIFGEVIKVRARIHTLNGFSAHAGQTGLLEWFECLRQAHPATFLTHGETTQREALARLIHERHGIEPWLPDFGESVEI